MRASIYTRVSTDEQVDGFSLEIQEERCKAYILSQGWSAEGVTSDRGLSGYYRDRPGIEELIEDAKKRQFNVIVVFKLDRFSRKLQDLLNIVDELQKHGVALKSVSEPFDTLTSHGKLQFQILGSFAEFERNRIKERVFPGMIKSVQQGQWQGARYAPFGYFYDKNAKKLIIAPEQAEIVKIIYNFAVEGESVSKIAKKLHNNGIAHNGKPFQTRQINSILKNPIYTGKIIWNRKGYLKTIKVGKTFKYVDKNESEWAIGQGSHEKIIPDEIFEQVQVHLSRRRTTNNITRRIDSDYLLSGIIQCGVCGESMYGDKVISNRKTMTYKKRYKCCKKARYGESCGNKTIYAQKVEEVVLEILQKITAYPAVIENFIEKVEDEILSNDPHIGTQMQYYRTKYENNKNKLAKLIHEIIDPTGDIPHDIIEKIKMEILQEQKEIEQKIKALKEKSNKAATQVTLKNYLLMLLNFKRMWDKFTNEDKKAIIAEIFDKIIIINKEIKELVVREPYKALLEEIKNGRCDKEKSRVYQDFRLSDECA